MAAKALTIFIITGLLIQDIKCSLPANITIGALLSSYEMGDYFIKKIDSVNRQGGKLPPGLTLNGSYILMDNNPIRAAKSICDDIIPNQVYVVIASRSGSSFETGTNIPPTTVSFTCGFYKIPVIGIHTRESAFSDQNVHTSFMRTVGPYSDQAYVWVDLLSLWEFRMVTFIHSSDQEGRAIFGKFQSLAELKAIKVEQNIQYTAGRKNFTDLLFDIPKHQSRVILLYASLQDSEVIFTEAKRLGLTGSGYVWFVSEQALYASNVPSGSLGLQLKYADDERSHIDDSVDLIVEALVNMDAQNVSLSEAPSRCAEEQKMWDDGPTFLHYLTHPERSTITKGKTGILFFNDAGDRYPCSYDIVNVKGQNKEAVGFYNADLIKDGKPAPEMDMFGEKKILWPPGNTTKRPKGVKISSHLEVVTIEELPFVTADVMEDPDACAVKDGIPCPHTNHTTGIKREYCCTGYAVELLKELSKKVNFTYGLHLVGDGQYGTYERRNSTKKTWNGMIGELINEKADLIIAPLTINPERADFIDFTKPFKYQGMTILVSKTVKDSSLTSFLHPFENTLWILVGLSVHVVALVLYLLDRFSPFGRYKLAKGDDTEEDALNLSSAMWFAWGVLLNSGIGEGTPRSFSARVLGMVWAGFAMIIVASYTANLAAFLVLDRPEASISGIDDARLRNPQENFKYATVKNSAVSMYFKRQVELSTMYRTMESRNYESAEQAIQEVRAGNLQAFIWDSSRLEYEAAHDCNLVTAGELFGRSGYGIGLRRHSPWTQEVSLAILNFHESGLMEMLDNNHILVKDPKCPEKDTSPATLGLTNMAGVFMMVAGGIVMGIFLIFIEITYKRHRGLKEKELELAKTAADRWRGNIEKRRTLRRTLLQQQQERNKVTNGTTDSPNRQPLPGYNRGTASYRVPAGYQPVATNVPVTMATSRKGYPENVV